MTPRRRPSIAVFAVVLGFVCALCSQVARAQIELSSLFTSGAVLQQGVKVPIFGTGANDGDAVTVRLNDHSASTTVEGGRWRVEIGPLKAESAPVQLSVSGGVRVLVRNVYIGEVWVCAGGPNMQLTVLQAANLAGALSSPENKLLHLFNVKREAAAEPSNEIEARWIPGGSASIGTFSAIGYYFGRELQKKQKVPVGLISCNNYASSIESWISRETLENSPALSKVFNGNLSPTDMRSPAVLYNAMVHPLTQYAVRGVIWYHGESSLDDAYLYRQALPAMISDWRRDWKQAKLPFLIVQHAPHKVMAKVPGESKLAELRESQFLVAKQTPGTVLVVITDHGDQFNQHPTQKEPVGKRLAQVAESFVYGEKAEYQGPMFAAASFVSGQAIVQFQHIGGGLSKKGDELLGFTLAGGDHIFHTAEAEIKGDTVVVHSDKVQAPEAVRFGWADFPNVNLFNEEGFPAAPFRSDNYPLVTAPKGE